MGQYAEERELEKAWNFPESPIYLSKNWKEINKYCERNNINLSKNRILKFLENRKSSGIRYDDSNSHKIAQTGKAFVLRGKFFSQLHGDHLMLSKKFSYGSSLRNVMIIICALSRYILVEPLHSLKYDKVKKAFSLIMERIKQIYPDFNGGTFFSDGGSEWISANFYSLLKSYNLKSNVVGVRPFRESKGSTVAEASIRRFRMNLETVFSEKKQLSFREKLQAAEKACNEKTNVLGISAKEALNSRPMDILMLSNSIRLRRRKYLRKELENQSVISLGTIVRVRLYVDKKFKSSVKESYSRFSPYYVVTDIDKTRDVYTYGVSDIFTFVPLSAMYSKAELKICDIDLFNACSKEEINISKVIKYDKELVYYKSYYLDHEFCAQKSIMS